MHASRAEAEVKHVITTLEMQEKPQFVEIVRQHGGEITVCPSPELLGDLVAAADIVQLEWWNHPATLRALCTVTLPPLRLLVWSHVSGLYNPVLPVGLIEVADRFIFTSPCSYGANAVLTLKPEQRKKLDVVSSSGGFTGFPFPQETGGSPLVAGYIGTLNFAKLHPDFVGFLSAVNEPRFTVRMIGDVTNRDILERQCAEAGRPGMLDFRGYTSDVVSELSSVNVLVYLLNPRHYGTTENALIEAMAMGIVPVVLDNPAERNIVTDRVTGLVVRTPEEFAGAVRRLSENPAERHAMGLRAAASVRDRFTAGRMESALRAHYKELLSVPKKTIDFSNIFGSDPADWFLSCQGHPEMFTANSKVTDETYRFSRYDLLEQTKGSVFHFQRCFPGNPRINQWAARLMSWR